MTDAKSYNCKCTKDYACATYDQTDECHICDIMPKQAEWIVWLEYYMRPLKEISAEANISFKG